LVGRFGNRRLLTAGIMMTAATLMLARLTVTAPVWRSPGGGNRPPKRAGDHC
jgi:hypothetical protein